jgi:hypothetical protein
MIWVLAGRLEGEFNYKRLCVFTHDEKIKEVTVYFLHIFNK